MTQIDLFGRRHRGMLESRARDDRTLTIDLVCEFLAEKIDEYFTNPLMKADEDEQQ